MKELTITQKLKVVKLFLSGLSYDEIAEQCGISKGSVVNIVNEFREGHLPLPPGMTEYIWPAPDLPPKGYHSLS